MFLELESCHSRFMDPTCVHLFFLKKIQQKWTLDFGLFFWNIDVGGITKWQNSCQNFWYLIPLNEMYARIDKKNWRKKFFHPQEDPLIMLYFCTNHRWSIGTKVFHYYSFVNSDRQFLHRFFYQFERTFCLME